MNLRRVAAGSVEPLGTTEVRMHLRVDDTTDNSLIAALITAAREVVEEKSRHALITQTWELALDAFPASDTLELPLPPLQAVNSIIYYDDDGVAGTVSASDYVVDASGRPGRVRLKSTATWPSESLREVNGVVVNYTVGFGTAAGSVDQSLRQAMLLLIGHWYENREIPMVSGVMAEHPYAVEALCRPYRYRTVRF